MGRGEIASLDQTWTLAKLWYETRLEPDWRRATASEAATAFAAAGLTGPFWAVA